MPEQKNNPICQRLRKRITELQQQLAAVSDENEKRRIQSMLQAAQSAYSQKCTR